MRLGKLFAFATLAITIGAAAVWGAGLPLAEAGNGAPSGPHYNLNIICVDQGKTADMTGTQGQTIFVWCDGNSRIELIEGDTFEVLDRNATDDPAQFQLPPADTGVIDDDPDDLDECELIDPDEEVEGDEFFICGTGITVYSVFARALGAPGGTADMLLCGVTHDGEEVCGTNLLELSAHGNNNKFQNVTAYLLYLYNVCIGGEGDTAGECNQDGGTFYKRIPLFSDALQGYFWDYTNDGLKLLQLRFYPCSTVVAEDFDLFVDGIVESDCVLTGNGNG